MLVVFPPNFAADTKIIYCYNFVALLNTKNMPYLPRGKIILLNRRKIFRAIGIIVVSGKIRIIRSVWGNL